MNAVFDTTILIDFLNGVPQAADEFERYETVTISVVSWIEVMAGTTSSDEAQAREFLKTLEVHPVDGEIAERTAMLRRNSRLRVPDAIIYATGQQLGQIVVTRNTKDFSATDPAIRIPYSI